MLGKGSSKLPTLVEAEYKETEFEDGESYEETNSCEYEYDYDFNANGTIAREYINDLTFVYTYANESDANYVKKQPQTVKAKEEPQTRRKQLRSRLLKHALKHIGR